VNTRYLFIDESGDSSLFDKHKRPLTETSPVFMMGLADIPDPHNARVKLTQLRESVQQDSYLKLIPSVNPVAKKTALMFHATDDAPEVRMLVFKSLRDIDCKVSVVVRRRSQMQKEALELFQSTNRKVSTNDIYDSTVSQLFKYVSHRLLNYHVTFAFQGKRERNKSLQQAIESSREVLKSRRRNPCATFNVSSKYSHQDPCLQIIDYYLWALHRFYVNTEDRYLNFLRERYNVILDWDDHSESTEGRLYSRHDSIELKKIMPLSS
jgi:hypothetical protein